MSELGLTPENPIVIDRATWLRGPMVDANSEYFVHSSTLMADEEGSVKRCCLGQICLASGVTDIEMAGAGTPTALVDKHARLYDSTPVIRALVDKEMCNGVVWFSNTPAATDAMSANDDGDDCEMDTEQEREEQTAKSLKNAGIHVVFSGPYAEWDERRGLTELS